MSNSYKKNQSTNSKSKSELRRLIQRYQRLALAAEMRDNHKDMLKYSLQSLQLQQQLYEH